MLHRSALPQVLLPMLAGAFLLSCGDPPGPVIPTTARIVVTPATDTLSAFGETVQLSAVAQDNIGNVIPGVAFAWSSSAGGVISISSSGVATAVTNGSATITAEVSGVTGSTSLTVAQEVTAVAVSPNSVSLTSFGATQQFTVTARDANNNVVANAPTFWFSSNHNVATVSQTGLATATGPGAVSIIAAARGVPGAANLEVTATVAGSYVLAVGKRGSGGGTITDASSRIDCGLTCSASVESGTSVTLTATSDDLSTFTGWSGACSGTAPCVITLDAAKTVVATFERIVHQLTVTRVGAGTVSSTPGGIYCGADCEEGIDRGTVVTLTPTPDAGAVFSGWTGACSGNSACTIPMDGAKSVTAQFAASATTTHLLTVTTTGPGVVSSVPLGLYCGAVCASSFPGGTVIALTATPAPGSVFAGWSGACSGSGACAVTLSAAVSVGASFEASATPPVTLTVSRGGNARGTVISTPAGIYCGVACSTSFTQGTAVTLTATPDAGAGFTGWGGACTGKGACTLTPSADQTVTASFDSYQLTVTQTGSGSVTSSVAGIDCGTDCSEWYPVGTSASLVATPKPGFVFIRWGGACSGSGPCSLVLGSDQTVTATFGATVTVTRTGDGGGTVISYPEGINCGTTCSIAVAEHSWFDLRYGAPPVGSTFGGWEGAGCSGLGDCYMWIDGPKTVSARFNLTSYALTVNKSGAGTGTVTANVPGINCGTDCTQSYPAQTTVVVTASAAPGWIFGGWINGGCYYPSGNTCTVYMTSAQTLTASFVTPVTVTVTRTGTGVGTVTSPGIDCGSDCTEAFPQGNYVSVYATAAAGSQFSKWTAGPCLNSTGSSCYFQANAAVTLTAEFLPATLVGLTVTKSGAGSGSVSSTPAGIDCGTDCSEQLPQNNYVNLVATPATGSLFSKWTTAPCLNYTSNYCSVYLAGATTVNAEFQPARTLTVTTSGNGRVNSQGIDCGDDCSEVLPQGRVVTLYATPDQNYYFVGWGGACSGTADCTLTINGNQTVTATFAPGIPLTVTVSSLSYGGVVVVPGGAVCLTECVYYFRPGSVVTLTGATTGEAQFDQWAGACNTSTACVITMSEPRTVTAMFKFRLTFTITGDDVYPVYLPCGGQLRVGSNPQASCYAHIGETYSVSAYAPGSVSWDGCDEVVSSVRTSASCNFTVTGPRSFTVTTRGASRFIVSKTGDATGTVVSYPAGINCGTDCAEDFLSGSMVTLTAVPEAGALFGGWGSLCTSGTTCSTVTVPATQGRSLTAQFGFPRVLTVSHIGTGGGTVSGIGISCGTDCSETYVGGTSVTLTATPGSGSTFAGWSGACTGTGSCVVMMDAAKTVTATFN